MLGKIKILATGCILLGYVPITNAQSAPLSITTCYTLAVENYPLAKQRALIAKSAAYAVQNISKGYFPQVNINGQASYQSDVTQIPLQIPGMDLPDLSKDQYKLYAEVNQPLFDGGILKQQKQSHQVNAIIEEQKLEVELYKLKERINQLFFGILFVDGQLKQTGLLKTDIQSGLKKTQAAIDNGTALKTSADRLTAELLKANQKAIELKTARKAYLGMLGLFINQALDENAVLISPEKRSLTQDIKRPELVLYEYQGKSIEVQNKMLRAKNRPKVNLFFQGGIGRPALNLLNNDFESYYIGGVRLLIPLAGFYTFTKEKALLDITRSNIDIQKETFLFNTKFALTQQNAEISKLQELLVSDDEIILLQQNIKEVASQQLQNGIINTADYLREVNAEDHARQNKILHEIQLLMAQYHQQIITGN